jgi:hypothetical protein
MDDPVRELREDARDAGLRVRKHRGRFQLIDVKTETVIHAALTLEQAQGVVENVRKERSDAHINKKIAAFDTRLADASYREQLRSIIDFANRNDMLSDRMREKLARIGAILNE